MFTVIRSTLSLKTHHTIRIKKYEYEDLHEALDCLERLRKEDMARLNILESKFPLLFYDSSYNTISYHATAGACYIYCEIEGILEDACQEFYVECQEERKNVTKQRIHHKCL